MENPFVEERATATCAVDITLKYDKPPTEESRPVRAQVELRDIELSKDSRTKQWAASTQDFKAWALDAGTPEEAVGRLISVVLAGRAAERAEAPPSTL